MNNDYKQAEVALVRYLGSVSDKDEAADLEERLQGIRIFATSKPEASVKKPITRPKIYRIPRPDYTDEAHLYRVEGAVRIQALFGKDGAIEYAFVVHGLGFGLDEEALRAARAIKFKPGEVDGKPTSMWIGVQLVFSIFVEEDDRQMKDRSKIALIPSGDSI